MTAVLGNIFIVFCLLTAAALLAMGWGKAIKWSIEEAQRAQLRKSTAAAMRYDRHLEKLRRQGMHVHCRRAKVW